MNSEVIDLIDPNLSCSNLERAPDERWASVGGLLNGRPIICGGFNGTHSFKDCFFVQGDHDKEKSMTQIRSFATAINLKGMYDFHRTLNCSFQSRSIIYSY